MRRPHTSRRLGVLASSLFCLTLLSVVSLLFLRQNHAAGIAEAQQVEEVFEQRGGQGHYVVCTLRFESDFIIEWINYHLWIGFTRVIIYDQDDTGTGEMEALLSHYISETVVKLIEWPAGDVVGAFRHGMRTFGKQATSLTFLDGDEYIVLCKHASVHDAYAAAGLFKSPLACLEMPWMLFGPFGSRGADVHSSSVSERLTTRSRKPFAGYPGKTVLRGGRDFSRTRLYGHGVRPIIHHCSGRREFDPITVEAYDIRVNHYQFRHGEDSIRIKQERGIWPPVRAAEYAGLNLRKLPWMQDSIRDDGLYKLNRELPTLSQPLYSQTNSPRISPTDCQNTKESS